VKAEEREGASERERERERVSENNFTFIVVCLFGLICRPQAVKLTTQKKLQSLISEIKNKNSTDCIHNTNVYG